MPNRIDNWRIASKNGRDSISPTVPPISTKTTSISFATPSKIFKDKVLPLALQVRRRQKKGDYTIVQTARNMTYADYEFLMINGINPHKIISRPKGNMVADGVLKRKQLSSLFNLKPFRKANKVMFDDNKEVKAEVSKIGVQVFNPNKLNERLQNA